MRFILIVIITLIICYFGTGRITNESVGQFALATWVIGIVYALIYDYLHYVKEK